MVYTGVCVVSDGIEKVFCDASKVKFKHLSTKEIEDYVDTYKPFDKAGAYGIQDGVVVENTSAATQTFSGCRRQNLRRYWRKWECTMATIELSIDLGSKFITIFKRG